MDSMGTEDTEPNGDGIAATNLSITELDDDTEAKLRGDAIGDTMYSQTFVAKTLLKMSNMQWNEELEEELCSLWDMTVERDVCAYLFELSYPNIASVVVKMCSEERLIEIVIGILANIFCATCKKDISMEDIDSVLQILDSDDPLILVQVTRFIKALSHFDSSLKFLNIDIIEKLTTILANSLNTTLLTTCLDTLASLSSNNVFIKNYLTVPLYNSSLTAYRTIISTENHSFFFESVETQTIFTHLLTIITGFSSYIDETQDIVLLEEIRKSNVDLLNEVRKVLQFYTNDLNLFPITDAFKFFIESSSYNFPILSVGYDSYIFKELVKIVISLIENNSLETEEFSEVLCYLVSNADLEQLKKDTENFEKKDVVMVLNKFKTNLEACEYKICKEILANYINK